MSWLSPARAGTNDRERLELAVESLESRQLLAGVVTVGVFGTTLNIVGDSASNDLEMRGFGVTGRNGTVIESSPSLGEDLARVRSVKIELGDGTDSLLISGLRIVDRGGSLSIDMGDGSNDVNILDAAVKNLTITNGDGSRHFIKVENSQIGDERSGNLSITNASGNSFINLVSGFGRSIHGNVTVRNGDTSSQTGRHTLYISDVRIRRGNVNIVNGAGESEIRIDGADRMRSIRVTTGNARAANAKLDFVLHNSQVEFGGVSIVNGGYGAVDIANSQIKTNVSVKHTGPSDAEVSSPFYRFSVRDNSHIGGRAAINSALPGRNVAFGTSSLRVTNSEIDRGLQFTAAERDDASVTVSGGSTIGQTFVYNGSDTGLDELTISEGSKILGTARITTHGGGSIVMINGAAEIQRNVALNNGGGDDVLQVEQATFGGDLVVYNGRGETAAEIVNSSVARRLVINNMRRTSFFDFLFENDGPIEAEYDFLALQNTNVGGLLEVVHGSGGSDTRITTGEIRGPIRFRADMGHDDLRINDVTVTANVDIRSGTSSRRVIQQVGGTDDDYVSLERNGSPASSTYNGSVRILAAGGDDTILMGGNTSLSNTIFLNRFVTVDGGDGEDRFDEGLFSNFVRPPRVNNVENHT